MTSAYPYGGVLAPSLVACFSFAAAVLRDDATPQHICTKNMLGSIVVEAHRHAQDAAAHGLRHTDPRRLLANAASLDDQLAQVAFADITWDAEGIANQTLEIEIQDIEERANAVLGRSLCVLFTASSGGKPIDHTDAALLWLPHSSERASNTSKKYLLYVVPGRVKVVKSLSELTTKLFEEIPVLKNSSAVYRVWTLIGARGSMKKSISTSVTNESNPAEAFQQCSTAGSFGTRCSDIETEEVVRLETDRASTQLQHTVKTLPTRPARPTSACAVKKAHAESIFAFPRVVADSTKSTQLYTANASLDQDTSSIRHSGECRSAERDFEVGTFSTSSVCADHAEAIKPLIQRSDSPFRHDLHFHERRIGLSASHNQTSAYCASIANNAPVYVSLDSEIKRHRDLFFNKNKGEISEDPKTSVKPSELNQTDENLPESQAREIGIRAITDHAQGDSIFRFSSIQKLCGGQKDHRIPSLEMRGSAGLRDDCQILEKTVEANDYSVDIDPVNETANRSSNQYSQPKKKKSARDHYRNKLGARGWWEIEYQATKILRHESQQNPCREPNVHNRMMPHSYNNQHHKPHTRTEQPRLENQRDSNSSKRADYESYHRLSNELAQISQAERIVDGEKGEEQDDSPTRASNPGGFSVNTIKRPAVFDDATGETKSQSAGSNCGHKRADCASNQTENEEHSSPRSSLLMSSSLRETVKKFPTARAPASFNESVHNAELDRSCRDEEDVKPPSNPSTPTTIRVLHVSQDISHLSGIAQQPTDKPPTKVKTGVSIAVSYDLSKASDDDTHDKNPGAEREIGRKEESTQKVIGSRNGSQLPSRDPSRFRGKQEGDDSDHDNVLMVRIEPSNIGQVTDQETLTARSSAGLRHVRNSDQDGRLSQTHDSAIPFNLRGRVPIRRQVNAITETAKTATGDDEEDPDNVHIESVERLPKHEKAHAVQANTTFTVDTQAVSQDVATQQARQMKLAELRQRKLQQLQRARDEAASKRKLQTSHHDVKQTVPEPVSFVLSSPKKETLAPPTTSAGVGEAFSLTTTTRAVRKPSNRKLIQNALEFTLLAGGSLDRERQAALHAMAESTCDNFIVLLKSAKELKFRGLYEHHIERGRVVRLFSIASSSPPVLTDAIISQFFRYNSGKKEFSPIDARDFTVKTDACALVDQLVFKKKPIQRLL